MLISLEMHMLVIKTIDMFTEVTPSHNDHHMRTLQHLKGGLLVLTSLLF